MNHSPLRNTTRSRRRKMRPVVGAVSAALMITSVAQAQVPQSLTINPPALLADDRFGTSVDTDSATIIAGAIRDDSLGIDAGAAYLVSASTGEVLHELTAEDPRPNGDPNDGDLYGDSVAIGSGLAVVGAPNNGDSGMVAGAAYVYDAASGEQIRRLLPFQQVFLGEASIGSGFGLDVDISANRIAVGAPGDLERPDGSSDAGVGAVYLYTAEATGPRVVGKFKPDDPLLAANFGYRVALTDTNLAVSAPFDGGFDRQNGSVYLLDPATGEQRLKIVPPDLSPFDIFGLGLDLSDDYLAVGAPFADAAGFNAGAAYVFDPTTGQPLFKFVIAGLNDFAQFGTSVSIVGTRLLVGAPGAVNEAGVESGAVFVFDLETGQLVDRLEASDGQDDDRFGLSVAGAEDLVAVGAPTDDNLADNAGSVYTFGAAGNGDSSVGGDGGFVDPKPTTLVSLVADAGAFRDEDILEVDTRTGARSVFFDGSDVGLADADVDAFAVLDDGSILLSVRSATAFGGMAVDDSDIVQFVPTSTGSTTAGSFSMFVDGSDVGLTTNGEDIDAIEILPGGNAVAISTIGGLSVPDLAVTTVADEDLVQLSLTRTGPRTAGDWSIFFRGSDVGLTNAAEDLGDVSFFGIDMHLTVAGNFKVPQVTELGDPQVAGDNMDVLRCTEFRGGNASSCTVNLELDGSRLGLGALDGIDLR